MLEPIAYLPMRNAVPDQEETVAPQLRVLTLTVVVFVAVVAGLGIAPGGSAPITEVDQAAVAGLIALGFTLSERLVFHIESKNEAVSFSPCDTVLALGLVLLSPALLVVARLVGAALGLVIWRRQPLYKFLFNLAAFAAETVVALVLLRSVVRPGAEPSPSLWIVSVVSLFIGLLVAGLLIAVAISFFERDLDSRLRQEIRHATRFYLPGALLGGSAAMLVLQELWMTALIVVPAGSMWLIMRSHGALMHRFTDLHHLHEFSSIVGSSVHVQEIADAAVREIADNLRATSVDLVAWNEVGDVGVESIVGESLRPVVDRFGPGSLTPGSAHHTVAPDGSDALVVPVCDGDAVIGVVAVAGRTGAVDFFSADDADRLRSITPQLASALRKGQLHVQIQHQATHDPLTGIPNRGYFDAWAERAINTAASAGDPLALLLIDLDRFKEVNDTLGHHVGDLLLVAVTERIEACIAEGDLSARLGGDEFAVVLPGSSRDEAKALADRIVEQLETPFDLEGTTVSIGGSIGIAMVPEDGTARTLLMRRADLAMYAAKETRGRAIEFTPELEGADSHRLEMLADLRDAVQHESFDIHLQPKVSLADGTIVGAEALARWTRGDSSVSPAEFVPLAEQSGLIEELTAVVLGKALTEARRWHDLGHHIGVAVNLSAQSLVDADLPIAVSAMLAAHGVPAEKLTLEITETTVMADTERTRQTLEALHDLGVALSVDDFGTGHSSLVNLRRLPVAEVKIDRGFVLSMLDQPDDLVIVRSTIDLGHNLGLRVVAEGVEDDEVLHTLASMGCDVAQGFGIARPMPAEDFVAWVQERSAALVPEPPALAESASD